MKLEYLVTAIKISGCTILNEDFVGGLDDNYNLVRTIEFIAIDKTYKITWFHNMSTLIVDNMNIMFDDVSVNKHWPVYPFRSKMNLNLMYEGNKICVIPTQAWE